MINIGRSTNIVVPFEASKTTYSFGNQSLLKGRKVKHLIQVTSGKSADGLTVSNANALLSLRDDTNDIVIDSLPTALLRDTNQETVEFWTSAIFWEKSELRVDAAAAVAGSCLLFAVVYE